MSSPHSEPRPTEQGIDLYRPDGEASVEDGIGADVPAPAPEEAAETAPQGAVIPFDPTITAAKTHLERLIERIAEDTDTLTDRMAGMEPRQQAVEQGLAREAEAVAALAEEVGRKLELMAGEQARLAGEGIDAFNRAGAVDTWEVENVLNEAGYNVLALPLGLPNTVIVSITKDGEELIPHLKPGMQFGKTDPRSYLPSDIVALLDRKLADDKVLP